MRLLLFPQYPANDNGYSMVVDSDRKKLQIDPLQDKVFWYISKRDKTYIENNHGEAIYRPSKLHHARFIKLASLNPSTELNRKAIKGLRTEKIDHIFCGDTIFYRAIRKEFPSLIIYVRFHNCFLRISQRLRSLDKQVDFRYKLILKSFSKLEKEIFTDPFVEPIFLCEEDLIFYQTFTNRKNGTVWGVNVDLKTRNKVQRNINFKAIEKLVYLGGLESHKKQSINIFINKIFPVLRTKYPKLEFHLFGYGTEKIQGDRVFGHGRDNNKVFPFVHNGLYINPDCFGGGVKLKIKSYLESGVRFISTPFGFEGYCSKSIDNSTSWISDLNHWDQEIEQIIKLYSERESNYYSKKYTREPLSLRNL